MELKRKDGREEVEIDFGRVMRAVLDNAWLLLVISIICAIISFTATFLFITPKYQSSAMFYVNNNALSVGDASFSISSGDLTTSRNLVESYIVILNTRETLNDVIDYAGVDREYLELTKMISASSVNETEIFSVVVESEDAVEAEKIADAIAYILPRRISSIIEGTSAKVVDAAVIPSKPSSPSYPINVIIGFIFGLVAGASYFVLKEILDITIRNEDDVTQSCRHPILTSVPDMTSSGKGGAHYRYGSYGHDVKK